MKLYRIKPVDKKSIEIYYEIFCKDENNQIRSWSIIELYRWGQGFMEVEDGPIYSDDSCIEVSPDLGYGCELEDLISLDMSFDDTFSDAEKAELEAFWAGEHPKSNVIGLSGAAWLYDGDHEWLVDYSTVTIYGPYTVDIIDGNDYNVIEENITLNPRPKN